MAHRDGPGHQRRVDRVGQNLSWLAALGDWGAVPDPPDGSGRPVQHLFELGQRPAARPTTPLLEGDEGARIDHFVSGQAALGDAELASTRGDRLSGARHVGIGLGELLPVVLIMLSHDGRGRVDGIAGHQAHRNTVGSAQMDGRGAGDERGAAADAVDEHPIGAGIEDLPAVVPLTAPSEQFVPVCTTDPERWTTNPDDETKALCRACPARWLCAREAWETRGAEGL